MVKKICRQIFTTENTESYTKGTEEFVYFCGAVKQPKLKFEDLILWEDADYFVLNKPPFVSTLQDRADPTNLLALAKEYSDDAQACHRLDKDTSGAIAFAKNPEAYRHLSMQFEHREVSKIYHAVVDGIQDFKD